jgi:uncharacterized iron-regulated protein
MTRTLPLQTVAALLAAVSVSAAEIDATDLYDLPAADVYFLGEVHDNPAHHAHQAIAVAALGIKALVFEMLTETQALRITPALLSNEAELEAVLDWNASGWPDFAMYYPIFAATPSPVIFGGAIDRDDVRRAVTEGSANVLGDAALIFSLEQPLGDAEQVLRETGQREAHCGALPSQMLAGMVEAQRLRDAGLARAVLAAMAETGGPVAVITGNGHARGDWGAPDALQHADPDLKLLTIGQLESRPDGQVPYDLWLVTDAVDRPDPCATFKQR